MDDKIFKYLSDIHQLIIIIMYKKLFLTFLFYTAFVLTSTAQWVTFPNKGYYYIKSCVNPEYAMDYNNGQTNNGNIVHCWHFHGGYAQIWHVSGNTIAPIRNIMARLDVNGSNMFNGNKIQIWAGNNSGAQKWYFQHHGGDVYSIHSSINPDYVIDLRSSQTYDGNQIQLWQWNGSDAQKWHFVRLKETNSGSSSSGIYVQPYTPSPHPCGVCNGTGRCYGCGGSGISPNHAPGIIAKCGYCGGSGRCSRCYGSGTTVY